MREKLTKQIDDKEKLPILYCAFMYLIVGGLSMWTCFCAAYSSKKSAIYYH